MTILKAGSFEFISHGDDQTRRLGMRLGTLLHSGNLVCLQGELGAGKTTFVQGVAAGWGSLDQVSSPTFQLVNQYGKSGGAILFHLDSYRIANLEEAEQLDIDTMLEIGPVVLEWPEMMEGILPEDRIWIKIEHLDETKRMFTFTATGSQPIQLLEHFHNNLKGN